MIHALQPPNFQVQEILQAEEKLRLHRLRRPRQRGEKDIAHANGMDDFKKIDKVPVAIANFDVGHEGTYAQPNGGEFEKVAVAWLEWQQKAMKLPGRCSPVRTGASVKTPNK